MKNRVILLMGILLFCFLPTGSSADTSNGNKSQNAVNVYSTPNLMQLASQWADQYALVEKNTKVNVLKTENAADRNGEGIVFLEEIDAFRANNPNAWSLVVGRDIVVPVMNAGNPLLVEISKSGITASGLSGLTKNGGAGVWNELIKTKAESRNVPMHVYLMNDPEVISSVSAFIKAPAAGLHAQMLESSTELLAAIQDDPGALAFCKLSQVVNNDHNELVDNLKLVPIDKNGNGRIDFIEDIYSSMQAFSRGVWIGKYPKALSGNVYAVSVGKPENQAEINFLNWILTQGQSVVVANGFNELAFAERQSQLNKVNAIEPVVNQPNEAKTWLKLALWALLGFVVVSIILDRVFRRRPVAVTRIPDSATAEALDEHTIVVPPGIYYDKTHTWSFMKKNGFVKVGIDDFLQHVTGKISRIELKKEGEKVRKGEILLTIVQQGKRLSIYSPVSGTITVVNKSLVNEPSQINTAPYTNGWVYLIEPLNWHLETQFMFVAEKYKSWLKNEFVRLKDFLGSAVRPTSPEFNQVVMQDGGSLRDHVLSGLSPEIWDDFQTQFLDSDLKQTI